MCKDDSPREMVVVIQDVKKHKWSRGPNAFDKEQATHILRLVLRQG